MPHSNTELGPLHYKGRTFGQSVNGLPLQIFEAPFKKSEILVMGSIHGDESLSTVLLSESMRSLKPELIKVDIILAANPDGVLAGTRCNANGVDLNRNYPAANWSPDPVYYRNKPDGPQNIALSPGASPGSEPETQAIIDLLQSLKPKLIVSIHGFLGCMDDPQSSEIARDMARRTKMEMVSDVGYATPGSFGSWCAEQQIPIITYELPQEKPSDIRTLHLPVLNDLLTGYYNSHLG